MSSKGLRPRQARAQVSVLAAIIASSMTRVVATTSSLPCITTGMPAGIEGVACVMVEAETFMHRDHGTRPAALLLLVD